MKNCKLPLLFLSLLLITIPAKTQSLPTAGFLFTVNHNGDSNDANPGDNLCADANGQCSLRAAIEEANFNPDSDAIIFSLPLPAVINLISGQLQIRNNLAIVGPGARLLTIQRGSGAETPNFRIFSVSGNTGRSVSFRRLKIANGNAGGEQYGGGIHISPQNTVLISDVAISSNSASYGGGIANFGVLNITRSTINANNAISEGGGIANRDGVASATITNSTITDNVSGNISGAIYNNASLLLINTTVSHNAATGNASGIGNYNSGIVSAINTIIGGNSASTVNALSGAFNSLGNNIVTDARGSTGFTNGVNNDQVSDNNSINPLLGPLVNNGGQTDTRALSNGSPAIDAGNNCVQTGSCPDPANSPLLRIRYDQRALHLRQTGASVDVGAFEFGSGSFSGSASFALARFGPAGRQLGALTILTNARTGDKRYGIVNPFGRISFNNLSTDDVYVLEVKGKRQPNESPRVFDFSDPIIFIFATPLNGIENSREEITVKFDSKPE